MIFALISNLAFLFLFFTHICGCRHSRQKATEIQTWLNVFLFENDVEGQEQWKGGVPGAILRLRLVNQANDIDLMKERGNMPTGCDINFCVIRPHQRGSTGRYGQRLILSKYDLDWLL